MTIDLMTFWTRAATIASGSPEVVARQVAFMNSPVGWGVAGANEVQVMLIEKAEAMMDSSAALFSHAPLSSFANWLSPGDGFLRVADAMMQPTAERVGANVDRLRAI